MEKVDFKTLKAAFSNKDCADNITLIRQLLYDFSYQDLSCEKSGYILNEIDIIRKGIFNFLYSGAFEDEINEATQEYFRNIIENYLIDQLKEVQESNKKDKDEEVNKIREKLAHLPSWDEFYEKFENDWKILRDFHRENYLEKLVYKLVYCFKL